MCPCRRSDGVSLRLENVAWSDRVLAAEDAILAVPLGATEQHGPHLPLSTDTEIALALVDGLAERRPAVIAAPALAYGSSGEHQAFPGTLSIGQAALERLLVELVRSASYTFEYVVFVCAHGGNAAPVRRAASRLSQEGRRVLPWFPGWSGDAHAGRLETSIMLALSPHRVRLELAAPGCLAPIRQITDTLMRDGVRAVSANGVLGDPRQATAAEGRVLLEAEIGRLAELVAAWVSRQ
jgi:mycofactocin precursor peptide peptidase